jgi:hypothetical protein
MAPYLKSRLIAMFVSTGTLQYSLNPTKLIVEVDPGISDFYRSLIPKYLHVKPQMYDAHISVVRKIDPPNMQFWGKYQCKKLVFKYEHFIYNDELYYWINVNSLTLEKIRTELGLKPFGDVTSSPDGRHKFHITLGNLKK